MTERMPRFGVLLPHRLPARDVVPFARAVEAAGLDDLWIPENFGFVGGYAAAAAALASTERIRVGTGISAVPLRHPVANAMEMGTLAGAFPGRYVGGLGLGVRPWLEALDRWPASPVAEITEAVRAVSALLNGKSVTGSAELFTMTDVELDAGVQCPCPLLVGAVGPAMLRVAAREGDGAVLSVLSSPEYASWARDQLDRAGGDTPSELVCFTNISLSSAGRAQAAELLRNDTAFLLKAMGRSALVEPLGIGPELDSLLAQAASGEDLARVLPGPWIEAMSIVGTPEECAARIRDYVDAGVDTLVLAPKPAEAARALVDRLPELLGRLRT